MQEQLKRLVDIASIELAYARAEVALLGGRGASEQRIAEHLDAAGRTLDDLAARMEKLEQISSDRAAPSAFAQISV